MLAFFTLHQPPFGPRFDNAGSKSKKQKKTIGGQNYVTNDQKQQFLSVSA